MDTNSTTARLRKTFRYPTDDGSDDSDPDAMDEEEQDRLIQRLATDNAARNAQFRRILLALPLLTTIAYLPSLFRPSTSLFALLALTSLLSTAYILHTLPPGRTGIAPLDAWIRRDDVGEAASEAARLLQRTSTVSDSPLQTYLPYLNLALVIMLALMGSIAGPKTAVGLGWIGLGNLPALVFVVVLAADIIMGSVDPERELSALRYQYKGA